MMGPLPLDGSVRAAAAAMMADSPTSQLLPGQLPMHACGTGPVTAAGSLQPQKRQNVKLSPDMKAFLRHSFQSWHGHSYDRKYFFAALSKKILIPQATITKFMYNDRRRNPQLYPDIRRQKARRRHNQENEAATEQAAARHEKKHALPPSPPPPQPQQHSLPHPQLLWPQAGEASRPVVTDVAWPSPPPPPPSGCGSAVDGLKDDELVAVSQLLSIRFLVNNKGADWQASHAGPAAASGPRLLPPAFSSSSSMGPAAAASSSSFFAAPPPAPYMHPPHVMAAAAASSFPPSDLAWLSARQEAADSRASSMTAREVHML